MSQPGRAPVGHGPGPGRVMDLDPGWPTRRLDLEPLLAHIHPGQLASPRVATAAGLSPASAIRGGEVCWIRSKTESPNGPGTRHS